MKILQKIIDCESLENSHEDVFYEVWFSKIASLQCTDCKSIKTDFATGFCRIFYEN